MFMFRDVKSDGGGVFETCGMVTEKGQWKPKPSYFYIATLKKRLAEMRFAGEIASGNANVLIYRFVGAGDRAAYVVWSPTSEDRKIADVSFALNGKSAVRIDFTDKSLAGTSALLTIRQGRVTLEVREKPVLVLVP